MRKEFGVSNRNGASWRFQPKMKEAPSFEGDFLVPATPPSGSHRGRGTGDGGGVFTGFGGGPSLAPSGSSSGTWNLVWNF